MSLIVRFKAIAESAIKNNEAVFNHYISKNTMRKYREEVIDTLESAGISFYEDPKFREIMVKKYHDQYVAKGVLNLVIG